MLSFRGVDNQSYYRLVPDNPRFYMDYTGTGNTLNPVHPTVLRLIMDSLRYFVTRVPRRRVPLRPRVGARARVLRGRPALGVLRHHPPGPGPLPGEADRRAVGRRPRRLPGRELPDPLVRVERHLPRHDARLLARARRRCATSPPASAAPPTSTRPTGGGRSRRSTSSPPTTASRCATSSPTTRSTTRRTARASNDGTNDNRSWNCGAEGPTDDRAVHRAARAAAAQLPRDAAALAGRADAARRRRVGAHAGRQQQRVVPGQRDLVVRLGRSGDAALLEFTRAADRAAPRAPGLPADEVLRGHRRALLPDVWWMRPDGRRMTRRDWDNTESRAIGVFLNGDELDAETPSAGRRCATSRSCCSSTRTSRTSTFRLPARRFGTRWEVVLSTGRCESERLVPGGDVAVQSRSVAVLRRQS